MDRSSRLDRPSFPIPNILRLAFSRETPEASQSQREPQNRRAVAPTDGPPEVYPEYERLKPFVIAISGGTSSGKTTLSRLLQTIFEDLIIDAVSTCPIGHTIENTLIFKTTVLHQDDFFLHEEQLPLRVVSTVSEDGTMRREALRDWDSHESINFTALKQALRLCHDKGDDGHTMKTKEEVLREVGVENIEAANNIGPPRVSLRVLENITTTMVVDRLRSVFAPEIGGGGDGGGGGGGVQGSTFNPIPTWHPIPPHIPMSHDSYVHEPTKFTINLVILDGFLLYHEYTNILPLIDLPLLLRTNYHTAKQRREDRMSYVSVENFWKDPDGYFDQVVWPNYVAYHSHLFEDGDVERGGLVAGERIQLQPDGEGGTADEEVERTLRWAVDRVADMVKREVRRMIMSNED